MNPKHEMDALHQAMMPSLEQAQEILRLQKEVERLQKLTSTPYEIKDGDFGILYAITNDEVHQSFYRRLTHKIMEKAEEQGYEYTHMYDDIDFADALTTRYHHGPEGRQVNTEFSNVLDRVNGFLADTRAFHLDDYTQQAIDERIYDFAYDWAEEFVRQNPDVIELLLQGTLKNAPEFFDKSINEYDRGDT